MRHGGYYYYSYYYGNTPKFLAAAGLANDPGGS